MISPQLLWYVPNNFLLPTQSTLSHIAYKAVHQLAREPVLDAYNTSVLLFYCASCLFNKVFKSRHRTWSLPEVAKIPPTMPHRRTKKPQKDRWRSSTRTIMDDMSYLKKIPAKKLLEQSSSQINLFKCFTIIFIKLNAQSTPPMCNNSEPSLFCYPNYSGFTKHALEQKLWPKDVWSMHESQESFYAIP